MALAHGDLTERIIGAAIEVHRVLGPGFLESVYEHALMLELERRGLRARRQVLVTVEYLNTPVGTHRLDVVVEDVIVTELKAAKAIDDTHVATAVSYLKAMRLQHGLILNFGAPVLGIRRVIAP